MFCIYKNLHFHVSWLLLKYLPALFFSATGPVVSFTPGADPPTEFLNFQGAQESIARNQFRHAV